MKYIVDNIKVSPLDKTSLNNIISQRLNIKNFKYKIISKSIDARDKSCILYIYRFLVDTNERVTHKNAKKYEGKETKIIDLMEALKKSLTQGQRPLGIRVVLYTQLYAKGKAY